MTKPREKTREEPQAEIEDRKKKIRQLENWEKVLRQKLSQEEHRTRSHRLIARGAVFESIVPEAKNMTNKETSALVVGPLDDQSCHSSPSSQASRTRWSREMRPLVRVTFFTLSARRCWRSSSLAFILLVVVDGFISLVSAQKGENMLTPQLRFSPTKPLCWVSLGTLLGTEKQRQFIVAFVSGFFHRYNLPSKIFHTVYPLKTQIL